MSKEEYAEFHKYLAMIIYEYNKIFASPNLTEEAHNDIGEILIALDKVMKICILDDKSREEVIV